MFVRQYDKNQFFPPSLRGEIKAKRKVGRRKKNKDTIREKDCNQMRRCRYMFARHHDTHKHPMKSDENTQRERDIKRQRLDTFSLHFHVYICVCWFRLSSTVGYLAGCKFLKRKTKQTNKKRDKTTAMCTTFIHRVVPFFVLNQRSKRSYHQQSVVVGCFGAACRTVDFRPPPPPKSSPTPIARAAFVFPRFFFYS